MTFEEAARRYLNAPTKKAGNKKSEIAVHVITWMAQDRAGGLLDKKTGKVLQYSEKYHAKRPELVIVWDETSGRFKDRQMSSINSLDAFDMTEAVRNEKGLGPAGINNYTKYLRALCNFAKKRLSVKFDDFPEFEEMEEEVKREEWLEPEEAAKLIRWLDPLRGSMVRMALATGLRNANVRLMRWEWVSPDLKELNIPRKYMKDGKFHNIQMSQAAVTVIKERLKARDILLQAYPKLRKHQPTLDYVFVQDCLQSLGNEFSQGSITNLTWKRAVRLAGLPSWVRFHSMRHTFATWHVKAGSTEGDIMEAGGWSSPASVARYSHQDREHKKAVSGRLDAINIGL
tara:strand:- start:192 stop:1220 length:1029 start_codon:yes stop_codon:yes gene_type:complete